MSSGTSPQAKKKGFTMPHTFVILVVIILIATALTWVIPSGEYARIEDPISGRKIVDATSFTYVDNVRVSPIQLPMLIINAFSANADLITLILLSGAAIHMLTATGALQALVASIVRRFSGKVSVFIPLLMLVFALICTTQGVNTFIAFAPITVMLALSLGLDSIVGVGIILLGGAIGFSTGTLNVSTTLVAQKIAELPNYSGIGYRWVCFAVFYVITCTLLVRYAKKIQKNPELSPMIRPGQDQPVQKRQPGRVRHPGHPQDSVHHCPGDCPGGHCLRLHQPGLGLCRAERNLPGTQHRRGHSGRL